MVGRYVALTDATCRPAPVQERLPLLVGGGGERRTLRIAATYADVWHTWADCEEFVRKSAVLDEHCAAVGRDPTEIRRATGTFIEEVRDVPSVLAPYQEGGVDEFVLLDHRARPASETRQIVEAALASSRSTTLGRAGLKA
jgi:alkanesulfonate monooxygenase SsuD/methylene tetrahydromethanopterin reductase-like flavin-dependent oxidoreductase (luciferase family)